MNTREYSVLIVDDDAMVRGWLRMSLQGSEFTIAGEAATAAQATELAERRRPDILLVDYRLEDGTGTRLVRDLRDQGLSAAVVLMTAHHEPGFNEAAREAGAQGTVLKTGRPDELVEALRRTSAGVDAFDLRYPRRPQGRAALSPREREILRLVAAGATNIEIAGKLEVGPETVKTLLARSFAKLGTRKRAEAVAVAGKLGLL